MTLYLTNRFIRSFSWFLTLDYRETEHDQLLREFREKEHSLRKAFEDDMRIEKIVELIDFIVSSDYVDQEKYDGYMKLKMEIPELAESDLLNLYAIMFNIADKKDLAFPAIKTLMDHYPEIVLHIRRYSTSPVLFNNEQDYDKFEKAIYSVLSDYVIAFCNSDDFSIWGENYDDGSKKPEEPVEGHALEEYEQINCLVYIADNKVVDRIRSAQFLEAFESNDVDRGITLIGNCITFSTPDLLNAVTVQIIGRTPFRSYKNMFETLGTNAFGFTDKTPAECAKKTKRLFASCYPEGPLALTVKKLPIPVLTKADLEELKEIYTRAVQ